MKPLHTLIAVSLAACCAWSSPAMAQLQLDMTWDPGAEDCTTPEQQRTQQHAIDANTIVIRQNPCVDYEAPLLYLLIGSEKALLIDSGATEDPRLTAQLTAIVSAHLTRPDGSRLPLVVAHTHRHQDHRAGDAAFTALPDTTVVPYEGEAMRQFFGLKDWPNGSVRYELGNRPVEIIPTPGHQADHVVFVDSRTRLLFSGDFLLPGRLLVEDIEAYAASALRLFEPVQAYGINYALGAHIELNAAGELYPNGASFHPDEQGIAHPVSMNEVRELHEHLLAFNGFYNRHANYTIVHPIHNLIALATGVILALVLLVWGVRRVLRARRLRSGS